CRSLAISNYFACSSRSTSYVVRQNLTMRLSMRRFTRLTNGLSKKLENHAMTVALYFMYYYLGRVHRTLCVTPARAAGIADHIWSIEERRTVGMMASHPRRSVHADP